MMPIPDKLMITMYKIVPMENGKMGIQNIHMETIPRVSAVAPKASIGRRG
jgi:hypothetical protein